MTSQPLTAHDIANYAMVRMPSHIHTMDYVTIAAALRDQIEAYAAQQVEESWKQKFILSDANIDETQLPGILRSLNDKQILADVFRALFSMKNKVEAENEHLKKYAAHKYGCLFTHDPSTYNAGTCTCGFLVPDKEQNKNDH